MGRDDAWSSRVRRAVVPAQRTTVLAIVRSRSRAEQPIAELRNLVSAARRAGLNDRQAAAWASAPGFAAHWCAEALESICALGGVFGLDCFVIECELAADGVLGPSKASGRTPAIERQRVAAPARSAIRRRKKARGSASRKSKRSASASAASVKGAPAKREPVPSHGVVKSGPVDRTPRLWGAQKPAPPRRKDEVEEAHPGRPVGYRYYDYTSSKS